MAEVETPRTCDICGHAVCQQSMHMTWLIKTLTRAYGDPALILGIVSDIARIIRHRQKQKREGLNTTCIACGGWIPKEREERRQHTCSDACQNWYRRLMREIDAGKACRYCGHGLPKDRRKWPTSRRPGRPRGSGRKVGIDPVKTPGASSQSILKVAGGIKQANDEISEALGYNGVR